MLDINYIRQNTEGIAAMLHNRQLSAEEPKLHRVLACDKERKELVQRTDEQKALRNKVSKEVAEMKKQGTGSPDELIIQMKSVSEEISLMDSALGQLEEEMESILLALPNKLHPSVPVGRNAADNQIFGEPVAFCSRP